MRLILSSFLTMTLFFLLPPSKCVYEISSPECDDGNLLNGYFWRGESWVPGFITIESHFQPMPKWTSGKATYYSPYTMEATAKYMGFSLDGYLDGVATMACGDIGSTVWIRRIGESWEGPFLVVDCAEWDDHYPIAVGRGEVIELGFTTAERWGLVSRDWRGIKHHEYMINVEVWKDRYPPFSWRLNNEVLINYPTFFLDNVEFVPEWQEWLPYKPVFFNDPPRWYMGDGFKSFIEFDFPYRRFIREAWRSATLTGNN